MVASQLTCDIFYEIMATSVANENYPEYLFLFIRVLWQLESVLEVSLNFVRGKDSSILSSRVDLNALNKFFASSPLYLDSAINRYSAVVWRQNPFAFVEITAADECVM